LKVAHLPVRHEPPSKKSQTAPSYAPFIHVQALPNGVLYLRKGVRFNEPDRRDLSGLHILRVDGATVVHSVDEGSPAGTAGVQSKDVILRIDGRPAEQESMFAIRQLLRRENPQFEMTIRRGTERFQVFLSLP
jgi:S1-C subfamily serine protease